MQLFKRQNGFVWMVCRSEKRESSVKCLNTLLEEYIFVLCGQSNNGNEIGRSRRFEVAIQLALHSDKVSSAGVVSTTTLVWLKI